MRQLVVIAFVVVGVLVTPAAAVASTIEKKRPPKVDQALRDACFTVLTLNNIPGDRASLFGAQTVAEMARTLERSKVKDANKIGKRFEKVTGPDVAYNLALTDASDLCVKAGIDTRPIPPDTTPFGQKSTVPFGTPPSR